jgi:hypothetical protein
MYSSVTRNEEHISCTPPFFIEEQVYLQLSGLYPGGLLPTVRGQSWRHPCPKSDLRHVIDFVDGYLVNSLSLDQNRGK